MAPPARHFTNSSRYGPYAVHVEEDDAYDEPLKALDPGERIGRPLANARRRSIVKASVVALLALVGGWAWLDHREAVLEMSSLAVAAVSPLLERKPPAPPPLPAALLPPPPIAAIEPQPAPPMPAAPDMTPAVSATLSPGRADPPAAPVEQSAEPLPPPVADPTDPLQAHALAVGLHPGLSDVLLSKLSPTDFHNAAVAIKTALSDTADADEFVWPPKHTPGLALFRVEFVPGASVGCRRYVVMVTRDGWVTTAPPMEKCGVRTKNARRRTQ